MTELLKLREEMLMMAAARPRMRRSTLWLLVVLGIALCGHPWTGAWFALPWLVHRRREITLDRERPIR